MTFYTPFGELGLAVYWGLLSYDGTAYLGWQKSAVGRSIQGELERALLPFGASLPEAASRTDRGVHAEAQPIAFQLEREVAPHTLRQALNARLPSDIRLHTLELAPAQFHPTLWAVGKEYHYYTCHRFVQHPLYRLYSWHYRKPVDLQTMERGAQHLLGRHDFSSFATQREGRRPCPMCTLTHIALEPLEGERLRIVLRGDRFLYKMARTLAGTLLAVGAHKLDASELPLILAAKKRERAGVSAPAHGLFLHRVDYAECDRSHSTDRDTLQCRV